MSGPIEAECARTALRILDAVPLEPGDMAQSELSMHLVLEGPIPIVMEGDIATVNVAPIVVPAVLLASVAIDYIVDRFGVGREEALFDVRELLLSHSSLGAG